MAEKNLITNEFANESMLDILCLSEHWCKEEEISFKVVEDYVLTSSYSRKQHLHGGVAIYVKKTLLPVM